MRGFSLSNGASPAPSSRCTTVPPYRSISATTAARVEQGAVVEREGPGAQGALPRPELQVRQPAPALDHLRPAEEVLPGVGLDGVEQEAGVDLRRSLQVGEPRSRREGREQVVEVQLLRA